MSSYKPSNSSWSGEFPFRVPQNENDTVISNKTQSMASTTVPRPVASSPFVGDSARHSPFRLLPPPERSPAGSLALTSGVTTLMTMGMMLEMMLKKKQRKGERRNGDSSGSSLGELNEVSLNPRFL